MPVLKTFLVSGLDLGQMINHSAFGTVAKQMIEGVSHYHLVGLEHFPLGTPYLSRRDRPGGSVTERVFELASGMLYGRPIAVDRGEVGKGILEEFQRMNLPAPVVGISITSGAEPVFDPVTNSVRLPKRELVMKLVTLFEAGRFHISPALAQVKHREVEQFKRELSAFKTRTNKRTGNQSFSGESEQDDVVCCVAYAVWLGENTAIEWDGSLGLSGPAINPPQSVFLKGRQADPYAEDGTRSPREVYGVDGGRYDRIPGTDAPLQW